MNGSYFFKAKSKYCIAKGSSINHVDTKGGGGVSQMSMFVYVGGRGGWMSVYVDIISHFSLVLIQGLVIFTSKIPTQFG